MGRLLNRSWGFYPRTVLALVLTVVAVALPSTAFYVAGSRSVAREALREDLESRKSTRQAAEVLAAKLSDRLAGLLAAEDPRPFYHYQNLYHDPAGAHAGASIVPSPLREGAGDPFILTHFQIDPRGRVTLPSLNEELPELSCETRREGFLAMKRALEPAAPFCCDDEQETSATPGDAPRPRRVVLSAEAWQQNVRASKLYADLRKNTGHLVPRELLLAEEGGGEVEVFVEPLSWRTVPLEDGPALTALRRVDTPAGRLVQGFSICPHAVNEWLKGSRVPVRFVADKDPQSLSVPVELGSVTWWIAADAAPALAEAHSSEVKALVRFHTLFAVCVVAAGLAGLFAVLMVWQAERLACQRSRFAASAAHELRTPLAGIRMYGEMIAEGLGEPARRKVYARRVADEAQRLGRVVTNVLGFSRLERGATRLHAQPGDLAEALRECVATQRPRLEAVGVELEVDINDRLGELPFDRDALCQIVHNLLDNAEKYTRGCPDRRVTVTLEDRGESALLRVMDRGPGIHAGLRGRLFKPFSRGTSVDHPAGLGLGLALARKLAMEHGGDLGYRDREGGGAEMRVIFPH